MKQLKDIISVIEHKLCGNAASVVNSIQMDSRKVQSGDLFVALSGTLTDGHKFITTAIENGAHAVLCEALPKELNPAVAYVQVENSAKALALVADAFYDSPSASLRLVGVTGTNGKTTIASLLYAMYKKAGFKVGLISTVKYLVDEKVLPSTHTTPDSITLNRLMAEMRNTGCSYCFMEVSSHAIAQYRSAGLAFDGVVFTNLTHDHLDYHKTFKAYLDTKKSLFDKLPKTAFALVNIDDKNGRVMVQNTSAEVKTYSLRSMADYKAQILEHDFSGMQLNIDSHEVWTYFIGDYNAYNLMAVYGAARLLGMDEIEALRILSELQPVEGRMELVRAADGRVAVVDYAHTPDALENVLSTLTEIKTSEQRIITVVGAGGDRDKTKRPVMAKAAAEYSDQVILTSDNPRSEEPEAILDDMEAGLKAEQKRKVLRIADRRSAIRTALKLASPIDVVLVAGKGHETYQEIKGVKHNFDDRVVIREYFSEN